MVMQDPRPDAPFYVVLNAGSGRTDTDLRCTTIREVLEGAGRRCEIEVVREGARMPDTAAEVAVRAAADGAILVAAGGDGTLNAVAHEAVRHGCVFGVLPQGTFNYFGRTHGIPEDLVDAVHALLRARVRHVQIGRVNNRSFLVNASVGLYPRLLEEREHDKQQYGRSRVVALVSALKTALGRHRNLRIELELDGKTHRLRTPTLFVGNNRLQMEQVGMQGLDHAVEEGRLAAIAPRPVGKLRMLGLLLRGALGRLGQAEDVTAFAFRSMTIRAPLLSGRRKIKVAADGEVCKLELPLRFEALEGRLALLVADPLEQPSGEPADDKADDKATAAFWSAAQ
jgi:diacylglycerol kinase family enzyme